MSLGARVFIILTGLLIFFFIFELVRRRRFREDLSILWFVVSLLIIAGAGADRYVNAVAHFLGVGYPPILIIIFLILILIVALMYFSMMISELKSKIKELTQKLAFLEYELNNKRDK
ncbi:MAG: DUF2304 domain-containing protein [Candidatus Magnetominusculus sp. LBB02]|nr:DUF2304 domain-containing protein [Candidatus Magnetominusculus sp. LBB02]